MPLLLTDEQKKEFDQANGRTVIVHPDTRVEYALVPVPDLIALIEDAEDQRERRAWAELARRSLAKRYADEPWGAE